MCLGLSELKRDVFEFELVSSSFCSPLLITPAKSIKIAQVFASQWILIRLPLHCASVQSKARHSFFCRLLMAWTTAYSSGGGQLASHFFSEFSI